MGGPLPYDVRPHLGIRDGWRRHGHREAKVSTVRWAMGDGTTVTCHGPGTPYTPEQGKSMSPDCGHLYQRPASDKPDGRYRGTTTATWSIAWTAPALGDEGEFTETRATAWTAWVGEVQVLNTN
ncbi:hypothetical protein ACFWVT_31655 [Streptomyces cyaneofuscatus]|uniref:hypothetical protein n=1 Tax=Streptomyces cyaneofuscatus TaxID=66883 RepID=UPI0036639E17